MPSSSRKGTNLSMMPNRASAVPASEAASVTYSATFGTMVARVMAV
jgi:hypothetical protein